MRVREQKLVRGEEDAGGGGGRDHDAADTLVEAFVEVGVSPEGFASGAGGGAGVLEAGFERVEGVDEEVDGEGGECAGLGRAVSVALLFLPIGGGKYVQAEYRCSPFDMRIIYNFVLEGHFLHSPRAGYWFSGLFIWL